jgi:hypothetical protein
MKTGSTEVFFMNNGTLSLLCFFLIFTSAFSQVKTYSGRVVHRESGAAVAGVQVTLLNSDGKAITDTNGQFSFSAEVSTKYDRSVPGGRVALHWQNRAQAFNLRSAPHITSLAIFNLKGERLFYAKRAPGADLMYVPSLSNNIFLLTFSAGGNRFFSVKWLHMGNNCSFAFYDRTSALLKQHSIISALVFEKQGYQTKRMEIDRDSTYTSLLVKLKPDIGAYIFDDDTLRTYRLYLTAGDMATLLDFNQLVTGGYTVNSIWVPARLEFEGRRLDSIAIRFRGDQSLWDCISNGARKKGLSYPQYGFGNGDVCAKFSMKFDFNKYKDDQRLEGLKALNFRSMSFDPTKMHEKLGLTLFDDMGITAPRSCYTKLYVNDTLWGLFCIVEEVDGRFTKSHYPSSGDGNLYKEIWPDPQRSDQVILNALVTNNDSLDNSDISDFTAFRDTVVASGTDSANFLEKMKTLVDIPYLTRYMAVDRGIMNFDGIIAYYAFGAGLRHNYYWYHDQESGLFKLVPWDLDKVLLYPEPNFWTNNEPNGNNIVPNWNVINTTYRTYACTFDPGSSGGGYLVMAIDSDKFLRLLRNTTWDDFTAESRIFMDSFFVEKKINDRLDKWRGLIADAVGEDPTIDSAEWSIMVDSLSQTIPLFRKNLELMIDTLIVN